MWPWVTKNDRDPFDVPRTKPPSDLPQAVGGGGVEGQSQAQAYPLHHWRWVSLRESGITDQDHMCVSLFVYVWVHIHVCPEDNLRYVSSGAVPSAVSSFVLASICLVGSFVFHGIWASNSILMLVRQALFQMSYPCTPSRQF